MYTNFTTIRVPLPAYVPKLLLIMKLTTFILMLSLLQVSAASLGQNLTMQQKNVRISRIFLEIRKQTGYDVILPNSKFKETRFNADFRNTPVDHVMRQLLAGKEYDFSIKDKTIVINAKEPSFLAGLLDHFTNVDVHGVVTDMDNIPLPGATVRVKGTDQTVTTTVTGEFRFGNISEKAVLQITYIGYQTKEVQAASELGTIKLELLTAELDQVSVVSTGYQSIPKERATGSFSKIDNKTYNRQVSTDVLSRLKGIAPSLAFDERSPNGTYLSIRGRSTIYGGDQPLIVVDNFPYEGDLNNLNPNDIEDISILKDAAAASIWGVRAGNGVIVIRTKRGQFNQPIKIDFNSNVSIGQKTDLFYQSRMKSTDFIDVEKMLFDNGYFDGTIDNAASGEALSPVVEILLQQRNNDITAAQANDQINALRNYDVRNDQEKYFYQKTVKQQYALNITGGSEKQSYFLSTGFDKNKLSSVGNRFSRISVNGSQSYRPLGNLEISAAINFNQNKSVSNYAETQLSLGGGRAIYPYAKLADDNGTPLSVIKDLRPSFKQAAMQSGFLNWDYLPLNEIGLQNNTNSLNNTRLLAGINYKIIPSLSADLKFQYEHQNSQSKSLNEGESYYMRDMINRYTSITGSDLFRNVPLGATLNSNFAELSALNGRGQLNYDHAWTDHQLTAIAGFEARQVRTSSSNSLLYGYDPVLGTSSPMNYDMYYQLYPSGFYGTIPRNDGVGGTLDRFRSYYANGSYTYKNNYTASLSGRIDQSNLFGVKANQKAVPLWSAGLKWDIAKETFYSMPWLPVLSIRSSYGYNGNTDKTLTAFTTAELQSSTIPYAVVMNAPNAKLQWEKIGIWNLGLDFASKNNRISGSLEYFTKRGKDMIGAGPLDPTTGFTSYKGNIANIKGKGFDVELSTRNILTTQFQWQTNFLLSYATDKVIDYKLVPSVLNFLSDNSLGRNAGYYSPVSGRPLFAIYSTPWAGLDPATGAPRGFLNGQPSTDYAAINAQISLDPEQELIYNGPALAPHFGAFRNTFTYRNFEASLNITYRFGYYFRRPSINYSDLFSSYSSHADYYNRWQNPGDEVRTNVPALAYPADQDASYYYSNAEILIEKGDHIRLQDATISYSLNKSHLKLLPFSQIKFFMYSSNLGLLWSASKKGIDPDFPYSKPLRTTAFGLNCSF